MYGRIKRIMIKIDPAVETPKKIQNLKIEVKNSILGINFLI
jgi:hypothetical protein